MKKKKIIIITLAVILVAVLIASIVIGISNKNKKNDKIAEEAGKQQSEDITDQSTETGVLTDDIPAIRLNPKEKEEFNVEPDIDVSKMAREQNPTASGNEVEYDSKDVEDEN